MRMSKNDFTCGHCKERAINFNIFNFLVFSLESISAYFNLSYNNNAMPLIFFRALFSIFIKRRNFSRYILSTLWKNWNI